jgi:hypothetical protein
MQMRSNSQEAKEKRPSCDGRLTPLQYWVLPFLADGVCDLSADGNDGRTGRSVGDADARGRCPRRLRRVGGLHLEHRVDDRGDPISQADALDLVDDGYDLTAGLDLHDRGADAREGRLDVEENRLGGNHELHGGVARPAGDHGSQRVDLTRLDREDLHLEVSDLGSSVRCGRGCRLLRRRNRRFLRYRSIG